MPIFLFINGLEDRLAFGNSHAEHDGNLNLSEYRRMVTSKLNPKMLDFASDGLLGAQQYYYDETWAGRAAGATVTVPAQPAACIIMIDSPAVDHAADRP